MLDASLSVFGELGYSRVSIETIAARADVSTRTIYNHFANKAALFQTTIEHSAALVAAAQIEIIDKYLAASVLNHRNVEPTLTAFATEWTKPIPDYSRHRALVTQVRAEVGRIPQSALDAWQAAGPLKVRRALSHAFAALTARGAIHAEDPDVAATHFTRLVNVDDPLHPGQTTSKKQSAAIITAGVHAFLYGYATPILESET